jgi:hypothetical protein
MKSMFFRHFMVISAALVLFVSLLVPAHVVAQGNGRGRGQAKKLDKFVNGHDARDGRWDGRGPRPRLRVSRSRGRSRRLGWSNRRRLSRRQMIRRNNTAVRVLHVR